MNSLRQTVCYLALGVLVAIAPTQGLTASTGSLELVEAGAGRAEGVTPPEGLAWFHFANHTHTTHSHDGFATVEERIREAARAGADCVALTDHRELSQCADPAFAPQDGCIPMCGEEWGGRGHACLLNMSGTDTLMNEPDFETVVAKARALGASVFVNHPFGDNPWPYDFLHEGVTGIEVWNAIFEATSGSAAVDWWEQQIRKGRSVTAIGGSDFHLHGWLGTPIANSLTPCNYVLAASAQPDDIQAALEVGRLSIARARGSSRCFIWCDSDGDGEFETPPGANVSAGESAVLRFRIEVHDGKGDELTVITGGSKRSFRVESEPLWSVEFSAAALPPGQRDYIRAELRGHLGIMESMTNPVYLNYGR